MGPRASWKGYLKLSLVACAVELYPATTTKERVAFHLLNRSTGNRLRRQMVDPETGDVVESDDQVRGYEIGKRQYVVLEDEEIEAVAVESTHTIDIESFVPRAEVDPIHYEAPYFLTPDGKVAEEAFKVIRDAMRERDVVGIGRVVLHRRERVVMLEPRGKGLLAQTLRYANEVRDGAAYFEGISGGEVAEELLELATHIIDKKLTAFDPARFEDRYQAALLGLIEAKTGDRPAPKLRVPKAAGNVVNLMDALRRSLSTEKAERAPVRKPAKGAASRKPAGRANARGKLKRAS